MAYVKVYKYKQQVSYDQGETWEDTGEYVPSGDPIGYYDTLEECELGSKYVLTLSDSSTVTAACDSTSTITQNDVSAYKDTLVSAEIGDCVTEIGDYAFWNCKSLTSATIGNSVTSISSYAFEDCINLTSVNIPDSVTLFGIGTFRNCSSLTSITIPTGVTIIGNGAFRNCSDLTSITIPTGVTSINYGAFRNCSGLTSITVLATTPPTLESQAFDNTNDCPIYVPASSVNTYKSASGWSDYASRIQAIP